MKNQSSFIHENIVSSLKLVKLDCLKPIEKIMPTHLHYIQKLIETSGYINKPLIIEKENNIILDGSHRYAYLKSQGYTYAPVIIVDYSSKFIEVGSNLTHRYQSRDSSSVSKKDVLNRALNKELYEPRTTRHFFPFNKENIPTKIDSLLKTKKCCIKFLTQKISIEEEIICNQNYINEINEELQFNSLHSKEQIRTKQYLQDQIEFMQEKTATPL